MWYTCSDELEKGNRDKIKITYLWMMKYITELRSCVNGLSFPTPFLISHMVSVDVKHQE